MNPVHLIRGVYLKPCNDFRVKGHEPIIHHWHPGA